ncbi:unnamed protein product [Boreogadus saida]
MHPTAMSSLPASTVEAAGGWTRVSQSLDRGWVQLVQQAVTPPPPPESRRLTFPRRPHWGDHVKTVQLFDEGLHG